MMTRRDQAGLGMTSSNDPARSTPIAELQASAAIASDGQCLDDRGDGEGAVDVGEGLAAAFQVLLDDLGADLARIDPQQDDIVASGVVEVSGSLAVIAASHSSASARWKMDPGSIRSEPPGSRHRGGRRPD